MLRTVDEDNTAGIIDLVDDSELSPSCRVQAFELTAERLPGASRILGDRAEDGFHDCGPDLVGQSVEVPETLRRDLNLVGHLHVILEAEPLPLGRLAA